MSLKRFKIKRFIPALLTDMSNHRVLWLFLAIVSIMSVWDFTGAIMFDFNPVLKYGYIIAFSIFKATVLTLLYTLFHKNLIFRIFFILFITIYALASLISFVGFQLYGFGISRKLILILGQTTLNEIENFMPGLIHNITEVFKSWHFYAVLIAMSIIAVSIYKCGKKTFTIITVSCSIIGAAGFIIFGLSYTSGRSAHFLFARIVKYGKEVAEWNKTYRELTLNKRPLPDAGTVSSEHLANTVIVVIGESASRSHWSAYGYPLPTTPKIEAMKDSLFIFSDVISSSKATSGNMERILSFKKDDMTENDALEYPLLIDYFKEAGYKTYWLSNQERMGNLSNTSGVMVMNADVIKYAGADHSEDALCIKYDDILTPYFEEALRDKAENKIIFLHLMGSHVEYKNRFPESFAFFNSKIELEAFDYPWLDSKMAQRRAEYDNSIRYTDDILAKYIKIASSIKPPALFLYFSDHGENVYDHSSYTGRDNTSVRIPFFIYANRTYREQYPSIIKCIESSESKPFSSANIVHLLLSLTGSKYLHYDPGLDIISSDYDIKPRLVDEEIWPLEHVKVCGK